MYIYPENLKTKATLGLWELKDIVIIGVSFVFGVFVFAQTKMMLFMLISGVYAFLTVRVDEISIKDFLVYATKFFISRQQYFEWRQSDEKRK